ncbi:hypothetical protein C8Q80DRAFT_275448 [Daedaleopsis nitida]|nr:hypothetical protein C8Q80DRAFT_275448 [Daedaleopsis nitida]
MTSLRDVQSRQRVEHESCSEFPTRCPAVPLVCVFSAARPCRSSRPYASNAPVRSELRHTRGLVCPVPAHVPRPARLDTDAVVHPAKSFQSSEQSIRSAHAGLLTSHSPFASVCETPRTISALEQYTAARGQ